MFCCSWFSSEVPFSASIIFVLLILFGQLPSNNEEATALRIYFFFLLEISSEHISNCVLVSVVI